MPSPRHVFEIMEKEKKQLRDIPVGALFIHRRDAERRFDKVACILRRTENPFKSETLLGSTIHTFPSDVVHPVNYLGREGDDAETVQTGESPESGRDDSPEE